MVAILLGADNGFFYAGQIMHFSSPFTVFLIYHKQKQSEDYILLSESFYAAAEIIANEIINDYRDNSKSDQWFFPSFYLYRQAIELLCKGLLISVVPRKDITGKLTTYKHNIIDLFNEYCSISPSVPLNNAEMTWLQAYLCELETIDRASNLFRYPIKDGYLEKYNDSLTTQSPFAIISRRRTAMLF